MGLVESINCLRFHNHTLIDDQVGDGGSDGTVFVKDGMALLLIEMEVLQAKFDETEKRNEALANDKQQLRLDLEEEQRSVRELRITKAELTNDIAVVRAMAANLENQVGEFTHRTKALTDDNQRYRSHAIDAETRVSGLETELTAVRETLAILQGENQSLQSSLSRAVTESSTLAQRNRELETAVTSATARIQQLESTLFGVARGSSWRRAARKPGPPTVRSRKPNARAMPPRSGCGRSKPCSSRTKTRSGSSNAPATSSPSGIPRWSIRLNRARDSWPTPTTTSW